MRKTILFSAISLLVGCSTSGEQEPVAPQTVTAAVPEPDFTLTADQTHNRFSSAIPPVVRVPDGSVIEAFTQEATGGQLNLHSTLEDFHHVNMDEVHTLTGPIFIEGAEPGDVLAVELLELEPGDWGWTGMGPDFGFLTGESEESRFKTYAIDKKNKLVRFADGIDIPLKPFPGVMGVAPPTDSMLITFPPRANGGNMDDPNIGEGVTAYFPVFVEGALFSIGDTHAVQGLGEVVGTAVECPMRVRFRVSVIKDRRIEEPQYESDEFYATTGFGTTIDEAAKKATRYMVKHISETYGLNWEESYMLCSLIGDLKIAEVVDLPHMLVTMHIPKDVFAGR